MGNTHIKKQIKIELINFIKNNIKWNKYFVCIYGSYPTNYFSKKSDLDLFFATENYDKFDFQRIKDFIIDLHGKYNLFVDEEVPYENKLIIKYEDIINATNLLPFKKGQLYVIPTIKNNSTFLQSKQVKLRLILNALTTPHIFIHGNNTDYLFYKKQSEVAIINLAKEFLNNKNPTKHQIFAFRMNISLPVLALTKLNAECSKT